ncbi:MAG: Uncharacterised protein [Hyphomonas sp. TMED17]|nr:MAG: Uncharacterised protein [Hyphomonas sp. TMED17]
MVLLSIPDLAEQAAHMILQVTFENNIQINT